MAGVKFCQIGLGGFSPDEGFGFDIVYADESKANSNRLATDGDHAGAAIWRRVTAAIEQLTDTTGPPHR